MLAFAQLTSGSQVAPGAVALLWPAGVAVGLLVLLVAAYVLRFRRALPVLGAAFVTQAIGALLVFFRVFKSGATALIVTAVVTTLVLLVVLGAWLAATLRARALEKKMLEGLSTGPSVDEQQLARLRQDMSDALALLRRAGRGSSAIYTLPWVLVVGRSQAGKTVAIKNSGLQLPVRKDWVKGVGGTHTCDWFFTDELIFLDTPGQWVTEGSAPPERRQWIELLRMLRKNRGERPLDGLVVVVPAEDLLRLNEGALREQAAKIRDVIDFAQEELGFRFPVYVIVSKCDLVDGFVDFFRGLAPERKNEMLGWSSARTSGEPRAMVKEALARIAAGLAACRLDMLAKVASRRQARRLFFFPEEFRRLEEPLAAFADALFREDPFHEPPLLRGFYFTSGTQGEGTPFGSAMAELARSLGLGGARAAAGSDDEPKRSYFLLDVMKKRIAGDGPLLSRTSGGGSKQRRLAALTAIVPAVAGLALVGLSMNALRLNRAVYRDVQERVPALARDLDAARTGSVSDVPKALVALAAIADYQHKLDGFSMWRGFGMRRADDLAGLTGQLYRRSLEASVLRPTLSAAQAVATDATRSCPERLALLHGAVKLRLGGSSWMGNDEPTGLEAVWKAPAGDLPAAAANFATQYRWYRDEAGATDPLPGFSIRKVADSIRQDCFGRSGNTRSALEVYLDFQNACQSASAPADLRACYVRLNEALRAGEAGGAALQANLDQLKDDLAKLGESDREAAEAKAGLESVQLAAAKTNECLGSFGTDVAPLIADFARQDELLDQCRDEVKAVRDPAGKQDKRDEVLRQQAQDLKAKEDVLKQKMTDFSDRCRSAVPGFTRLEIGVVKRVTEGWRKGSCLDLGSQWGDVGSVFDGVRGRFPIGGENAPMVELKSLVDVFGGATGFVVKFREATQGKGLAGPAQRWLDNANALSRLLFETGTDTPRALKVRLTQVAATYDPPDLEKKLKIEQVTVRLGEGAELEWREGDPATREATVDLFGARASEVSSVAVVMAQRKGLFGRAFGADFKEGKPIEVASAQGTWAPIRLLQKGGGGGTVAYTVDVPLDKKKTGKVTLRFQVDGSDVGRLAQLMKSGFPAPPAQGAGE